MEQGYSSCCGCLASCDWLAAKLASPVNARVDEPAISEIPDGRTSTVREAAISGRSTLESNAGASHKAGFRDSRRVHRCGTVLASKWSSDGESVRSREATVSGCLKLQAAWASHGVVTSSQRATPTGRRKRVRQAVRRAARSAGPSEDLQFAAVRTAYARLFGPCGAPSRIHVQAARSGPGLGGGDRACGHGSCQSQFGMRSVRHALRYQECGGARKGPPGQPGGPC